MKNIQINNQTKTIKIPVLAITQIFFIIERLHVMIMIGNLLNKRKNHKKNYQITHFHFYSHLFHSLNLGIEIKIS